MKKAKTGNDRHHKHPRSKGGTNEDSNISIVKISQHRSWHALFQNYSPEKIAEIINQIWLDPAFKFVVKRR